MGNNSTSPEFPFKVEGEKLTGRAKSAFANADTAITEGVDDIKFSRNIADIADEPFDAKRAKQ